MIGDPNERVALLKQVVRPVSKDVVIAQAYPRILVCLVMVEVLASQRITRDSS